MAAPSEAIAARRAASLLSVLVAALGATCPMMTALARTLAVRHHISTRPRFRRHLSSRLAWWQARPSPAAVVRLGRPIDRSFRSRPPGVGSRRRLSASAFNARGCWNPPS
jgi:hypothetical protein